MNLAKIFDLVRCSRNNISCDANTLTLDDARNKYKDYQYAIVNALSGMPVWICKTIEDAKETIKEWQPYCSVPFLIVDLWKGKGKTMKICDAVRLCKTYGEDTTLAELQKEIQGNKIHRCPKCYGEGIVIKMINRAQYWECRDRYEETKVTCDLCNGEGYTEKEYKPKMVQDGWECK